MRANESRLTDSFYGEVTLDYHPIIAQVHNGRPFRIAALQPILMFEPTWLEILTKIRAAFSTNDWRNFLILLNGFEPTALDERAKMVVLLKMAPLVERNFNLGEQGPCATGKRHLYQQVSPSMHMFSSGKASAIMVVGCIQ